MTWDSPDLWGREHRRLARSAYKHAYAALKAGNVESAAAWSAVYCRHSREILGFMQFKRLVILDTDGLAGAKIPEQQAAAEPVTR